MPPQCNERATAGQNSEFIEPDRDSGVDPDLLYMSIKTNNPFPHRWGIKFERTIIASLSVYLKWPFQGLYSPIIDPLDPTWKCHGHDDERLSFPKGA